MRFHYGITVFLGLSGSATIDILRPRYSQFTPRITVVRNNDEEDVILDSERNLRLGINEISLFS